MGTLRIWRTSAADSACSPVQALASICSLLIRPPYWSRHVVSGSTMRMGTASRAGKLITTAGRSRCTSTPTARGRRTSQTSPRVGESLAKDGSTADEPSQSGPCPTRESRQGPRRSAHRAAHGGAAPADTEPGHVASTGSRVAVRSLPGRLPLELPFRSSLLRSG